MQPQSSYLLLTLKKSLQLPVYKNPASVSFTAIFFKDKNSNDVFDDGDEPLPAILLKAGQQLVQTNESGEIFFRHVNEKPIQLDLTQTNLLGWTPQQGLIQTLLPSKKSKTIMIAFRQSRSIAGRLAVVSENAEAISLAGIRITATDEQGQQASTLTDQQGQFRFNLPAGNYIVTINAQALGEPYRIAETAKAVDLVHNHHVDLQFEIRQQKRPINIRRIQN